MSLLADLKSAFRRGDCATARAIVSKMNVRAKTPAEREQIYRLQNAVRRCKTRGVAGARRRRRRR